jgi:hypothetical protein
MNDDPRLVAMARRVIDQNLYVTIGSATSNGDPWVTPVYFTPVDHHEILWVSSPAATHSRNIEARPLVRLVVFDSGVEIGQAEAVYMSARAAQVPDEEVPSGARAFAARRPDRTTFTTEELTGDGDLRLYRARVLEHSVLVRGGDPTYGNPVDTRVVVRL